MNETTSTTERLVTLFLERYSVTGPDLFCPEIEVYNTLNLSDFWKIVQQTTGSLNAELPYWAVIWPGGRALARYLLDHPEPFQKRRILDIGCGSGISTIAATMIGADATGIDIDPAAIAIAERTARNNGVNATFRVSNPFTDLDLDTLSDHYDLVIASDVFHEENFARELITFMTDVAKRGIPCYAADAGRQHRPKRAVHSLERYRIPVFVEIEGVRTRDGEILQILP